MRGDILERLRVLLRRDFRVGDAHLHESATLRGDMRLDSLSLVDLVYLIEKDFGFKASTEDFRDAVTLTALADVVERKLAA